jgi:hypothetical protein
LDKCPSDGVKQASVKFRIFHTTGHQYKHIVVSKW